MPKEIALPVAVMASPALPLIPETASMFPKLSSSGTHLPTSPRRKSSLSRLSGGAPSKGEKRSPPGGEMVGTTRSCSRDSFLEFLVAALLQGAIDGATRWRAPGGIRPALGIVSASASHHVLATGCQL